MQQANAVQSARTLKTRVISQAAFPIISERNQAFRPSRKSAACMFVISQTQTTLFHSLLSSGGVNSVRSKQWRIGIFEATKAGIRCADLFGVDFKPNVTTA